VTGVFSSTVALLCQGGHRGSLRVTFLFFDPGTGSSFFFFLLNQPGPPGEGLFPWSQGVEWIFRFLTEADPAFFFSTMGTFFFLGGEILFLKAAAVCARPPLRRPFLPAGPLCDRHEGVFLAGQSPPRESCQGVMVFFSAHSPISFPQGGGRLFFFFPTSSKALVTLVDGRPFPLGPGHPSQQRLFLFFSRRGGPRPGVVFGNGNRSWRVFSLRARRSSFDIGASVASSVVPPLFRRQTVRFPLAQEGSRFGGKSGAGGPRNPLQPAAAPWSLLCPKGMRF